MEPASLTAFTTLRQAWESRGSQQWGSGEMELLTWLLLMINLARWLSSLEEATARSRSLSSSGPAPIRHPWRRATSMEMAQWMLQWRPNLRPPYQCSITKAARILGCPG